MSSALRASYSHEAGVKLLPSSYFCTSYSLALMRFFISLSSCPIHNGDSSTKCRRSRKSGGCSHASPQPPTASAPCVHTDELLFLTPPVAKSHRIHALDVDALRRHRLHMQQRRGVHAPVLATLIAKSRRPYTIPAGIAPKPESGSPPVLGFA